MSFDSVCGGSEEVGLSRRPVMGWRVDVEELGTARHVYADWVRLVRSRSDCQLAPAS